MIAAKRVSEPEAGVIIGLVQEGARRHWGVIILNLFVIATFWSLALVFLGLAAFWPGPEPGYDSANDVERTLLAVVFAAGLGCAGVAEWLMYHVKGELAAH